jgi:hypothetical protein
VHFHSLFIDGSYEIGPNQEPTDFWTADPPTIPELDATLAVIIKRLTRYLEKQNIIVKDENQDFQLEIPDEDTLGRLQQSSVTYRFATGPRRGKKALVLKCVQDGDHNSRSGLVAKNSGFSLHAGVAAKADERDKLEKICRYIARPAIAEGRLSLSDSGDVIYRFKKPWDDGTAAIKMSPMELMEKLAALVPRPRIHLTRYHGVLGPHDKHRKLVIPKMPTPAPSIAMAEGAASDKSTREPKRISWARLLKRVFNIDVSICPKCTKQMRIIAAIEDPNVIKKILDHLGRPSAPPRLHPARGPPIQDDGDLFPNETFENI